MASSRNVSAIHFARSGSPGMRTWGAIWPGSAPMWVLMARHCRGAATTHVLGSERASCRRRVPARRTPWTWPCPSAATSGSGSGVPTTPGSPRPGPTRRTRVLVLAGGRFPLTDDRDAVRWLAPAEAPEGERLLLGEREGVVHYAVLPTKAFRAPDEWGQLRELGPDLPAVDRGFLVQAQAMWEWRRAHRFCGRCGGGLARGSRRLRRCSARPAGASTSPAPTRP